MLSANITLTERLLRNDQAIVVSGLIALTMPSAAPMVLLYARVARRAQSRGQLPRGPLPTMTFVSGYLVSWLGFSVAATAAQ